MTEDDKWRACIREVSEVLIKHGMTLQPAPYTVGLDGHTQRYLRFRRVGMEDNQFDSHCDFLFQLPIDPKTWARGTIYTFY